MGRIWYLHTLPKRCLASARADEAGKLQATRSKGGNILPVLRREIFCGKQLLLNTRHDYRNKQHDVATEYDLGTALSLALSPCFPAPHSQHHDRR
jgi:hypothetical protein